MPTNTELAYRPFKKETQTECGMFGLYLFDRSFAKKYGGVNKMLYSAGTGLQHRAEGAAGAYASDGITEDCVRELGTVAVALEEGRRMPNIENPHIGIVHTRWASAGRNDRLNIQPLKLGDVWMGHHGTISNAEHIARAIQNIPRGDGYPNSDTWIALNSIDRAPGHSLAEKVTNAQRGYGSVPGFEGGYATIVTNGQEMVISRDPYAIRPLFIAQLGSVEDPAGYAASVETCVFSYFDAKRYREVKPGETIKISKDGVRRVDYNPKGEKQCIFESKYVMRPDSVFMNRSVFKTRFRDGQNLWREHPIELEEGQRLVVMPVPNSGRPGALGFMREAMKKYGSRVVYDERILAHAYFGRNFLKDIDRRAANFKFYPIPDSFGDDSDGIESIQYLLDDEFGVIGEDLLSQNGKIKDQNVVGVVVDDSIVRGDTMPDLIEDCREAGLTKIHARILSDEIKQDCPYGIPMGSKLIAKQLPNISDREEKFKVNSLRHLSVKGMVASLDVDRNRLCTECFDGNGPPYKTRDMIPLEELKRG